MGTWLRTGLYFIVLVLVSSCASKPDVYHLVPPNLEESHLGKRVVGYRPWHETAPTMKVEHADGRYIVHNYGHGGSGWTIAPAGTLSMIRELEKESKDFTKDSDITIVGFGATGIFTAYNLEKLGYKNITVLYDKNFSDVVSSVAGGIWEPAYMPDDRKILRKNLVNAYKFYSEMARGINTDIAGVSFKPLYAVSPAVFSEFIPSIMPKPKKVVVDFDNGIKRTLYMYPGNIEMNPQVIHDSTLAYLQSKGVKFKKQKIKNFKEIKAAYIFNCTGLASEVLNQDAKLVPIQGHLIFLKNQSPEIGKYFFSASATTIGVTPSKQRVERGSMLYPRTTMDGTGIIGWTGVWNGSDSNKNEQEFDLILQRSRQFFYGK